MWFGVVFVQGFKRRVGRASGARGGSGPTACRRRRASPRRAGPRARRRARSCTGSASTRSSAQVVGRTRRRSSTTRVLVPSAFTRMSFVRLPPLLVEGRLDHLVVAVEVEALSAASGSSGRARCRSWTTCCLASGRSLATLLPCLRCASRQSRPTSSGVRPGAAISRSLTIGATACDARLGVHQLDPHFDRVRAGRRRERPWRRDRAAPR